ncbi:hypothetical protein BGZ76_003060 [Entomortierella beljakovae]|nr:hypothetical protein BGZ76_003060 [Entomortierella beljakovae]
MFPHQQQQQQEGNLPQYQKSQQQTPISPALTSILIKGPWHPDRQHTIANPYPVPGYPHKQLPPFGQVYPQGHTPIFAQALFQARPQVHTPQDYTHSNIPAPLSYSQSNSLQDMSRRQGDLTHANNQIRSAIPIVSPQSNSSQDISKRQLDVTSYTNIQSRSAIPLESSQSPTLILDSTSRQKTPSVAMPASRTRSSRSEGSKTFWNSKGMDAFVDWVTDPENHQRLNNPRPTSGKRASDIHLEIADYINSLHDDLKWTAENVKSKIQYAKKKYAEARALSNSTGEGDTDEATLRERILAILPEYDRFHGVYSTSLSRNPPRPKQSVVYLDDQPAGDADGIEDNISELSVEDLDEVGSSMSGSHRKRRRKNNSQHITDTMTGFATAAVTESSARAKAVESSLIDLAETRKDVRRRELAIEEREKESYQRMAEAERKHQEILDRKHQEMLDRRQKEYLEEKAELKAERAELKAERAELKAEKAEMKAEREAFKAEKEKLVSENAVLKRELEIRDTVKQYNSGIQAI